MLILKSRPVVAAAPAFPGSIKSPLIRITALIHEYRTVPLSYSGHARGMHPVFEGHGCISWEGLTERDMISALARFPELVKIVSQPLTVFYEADGEAYRYTPDFSIRLTEVPPELEVLGFELLTYVECKPAELVPEQRLKLDRNFRAMKLAVPEPMLLILD